MAARGGKLQVLQWLRANGCPWDQNIYSNAVEGGHLEVLKWLRANGYPLSRIYSDHYESVAAANQHFDVRAWLRENMAREW
jgi:hypothetical protein